MDNRLAYHVVGAGADEAFQIAMFDRPTFLLGFLGAEGRVYVCDQDLQVSSFGISGPLIAFQSEVLKCDASKALPPAVMQHLKEIPAPLHAKLALFLNRRGFVREALKLSPDAEFKFNLAVQLGELAVAQSILSGSNDAQKWSDLGRAAVKAWNLRVAEEAFLKAADLPNLFLLYAAAGDESGLLRVGQAAAAKGQVNLAFSAFYKAGNLGGAFDLLMAQEKFAEAAVFARTFGLPAERITAAVKEWRRQLRQTRLAEAIADPTANPELFSGVKAGRGRSVSFDGSVSVAGSKVEEALKFNGDSTEISVNPIPIVNAATSAAVMMEPLSASTTDYGSIASDDHLSLEVNTAGTGTQLEDLEEQEDGFEGVSGEVDLDNLAEPSEVIEQPIEESVEEEVLEIVEGGADVYEFEGIEEAIEEIAETIEPVEETFEGVYEEPIQETIEAVYEEPIQETIEPVESTEQYEPVQDTFDGSSFEPAYHEPVYEKAESAQETYETAVQNEPAQEAYEAYEAIEAIEPVQEAIEEPTLDDSVYETYESYEAYEPTYEPAYETYEETRPTYDAYEEAQPVYEETPIEASEPVFEYSESNYDYGTTDSNAEFEYGTDAIAGDNYGTEDNVQFDKYAEDNFHAPIEEEKKPEVHEEIDFGGDGDADGWL